MLSFISVLYDIPMGLDRARFFTLVKERFVTSKFISKLFEFVEKEKYFGQVKEWIQNNCTDVPVPSRRSLTGNIQVLYRWIADLCSDRFAIDRPQYSQRIYRIEKS